MNSIETVRACILALAEMRERVDYLDEKTTVHLPDIDQRIDSLERLLDKEMDAAREHHRQMHIHPKE